MQYFRCKLLTALVLAAVTVALASYTGTSSAGAFRAFDPVAPVVHPPNTGSDPNTGEPDSGSTHGQPAPRPTVRTQDTSRSSQVALHAFLAIRWTSIIWAKRILGVG